MPSAVEGDHILVQDGCSQGYTNTKQQSHSQLAPPF